MQRKLTFTKRGVIYGPIRISADETDPVGKVLVKPTTDHGFIRDKIALFFVRDPRDILVSSYYSFGFTHGLSRVDEIRERQEARRKIIREQTLDEYVLQSVENQINLFSILYDLSNACERSVILKYEDMINDFDTFVKQLLRYVSLSDGIIQGCYERSRPKMTEDKTSHRRSGHVQGFRHKLEEDTIETLNRKLADTLTLFGYKA
ncbi:MAG: sulfotransferase domain-containing protein [Cyanobacteria bacterium P01_A01_bin.123]